MRRGADGHRSRRGYRIFEKAAQQPDPAGVGGPERQGGGAALAPWGPL